MKNNAVLSSALAVSVAVLLAGCSSFGDFGRRGAPVAAARVAEPLQPTALAEAAAIPAPRPAPPAVTAAANIGASTASPNLGVVPAASEGKVLTPEEKFRVIAELEALARRQGAATEQTRAQLAACPDLAAMTVEERMKHVAEGLKC